MKETYLFRQDAGDLNVGRRAACLDVETKEFIQTSANQIARESSLGPPCAVG